MEDKRIVALFWERREQALELVREKYGKLCRRIARNLLGNDEDTEECENDTYLAAWRAIPPAKPDSLSAFLGRITRNIALNRVRDRTRQKRGGEAETLLPELCEVAGGTVEETFDSAETAAPVTLPVYTVGDDLHDDRSLFMILREYADLVGDPLAAIMGEGPTRASATGETLKDYPTMRSSTITIPY